jgi:cytochrome P450
MSQHSGYRLEVLASMLERELGYDPYERPELSAREHVAEPLRSMLPSEFNADAFRTFEIPLERFGRMWSAIVLRGTRSLAALPAEDVLHLSYETLLVEPATQIERLLEFLALEPPDRSWLAEASGRVRAPADVQAPPDLALARACESGMRRLRTLAGPGSNGAKRESAPGPAAPRARRRAVADLPPGPSEGLASLLGRFLADPERVFSECHERFGDCFTLPLPGVRRRLLPSVVVSDPDAIRELFASGPALSTVVPSRFIMASTLGMESTFLLDDDVHFARRRMISAYFHHEPLKRWQQLAAEIAEREVAAWPLDQPIELGPLLYGVVLEIILQVVLGDSAAERLSEVRALVPGIWGDDGPRSLALRSGAPGDLPSRHAVDQLLSAEVQARREASGNGHADVLSALLEPRGEQAMLTDVELRDELVTLLLAGHENSAAGMAWTFELLLRHPEALERARRDAIGGDGTYLDAVLREAMRCKPPVMFVNRTLRRPWEVLGHRLPAGTDVAACIYLVHQRPELYPEPECFRPERFLDGEPPRFSWLAFGGGLRRCLGAAFAEVEMREVLRAVLSRTEPELVEPGPLPPGTWRSVVMRPSGATRAVLRSQARIGDER